MGLVFFVLLLSVERDQERGKGAGLYNSFRRVNPASENEEEDLMKAFLAPEVDMVSDVHIEGKEGGVDGKGLWAGRLGYCAFMGLSVWRGCGYGHGCGCSCVCRCDLQVVRQLV